MMLKQTTLAFFVGAVVAIICNAAALDMLTIYWPSI